MKTRFYTQAISLIIVCLLCVACKEPQEKYDSYIQKGDSFYQQSDFTKAKLEYKNAAQILPSSASAIYKLGLVEEAQGNFQNALSAFLTAEQQDATFKPVLLKLAEFYIIAQQYEAASQRIEETLALDPQNAQARALKASILLNEKSYRLAKREVDASLANDPSNMIAYSVMAGIHIAQEQYEQALEVIEKGIELHPQELSFYLLEASVYSEQKDIGNIVRVYNGLFARFPDKIGFRYDLAQILIEFDQNEQAQKVYEETVKQFPDNNEAKLRLIKFIETQKGISNAKEEIEYFIKSDPEQKIFALWLADLYARNDQHEQAIATLKSVINTDPDTWIGLNAQTTLAQIQLSVGDIEFAQNLIDTVLSQELNNLDARFLKANLSLLQGDQRQAISEFRDILNNDPSFLRASRMLAETLLLQGRIDLAIDTLLQSLKTNAGNKSTLVRLAQFYALRGESDTALEVMKNITDLHPKYALAWESTARIALDKGDATTTQNAIKKLIELGGQDTMAKFLQAKLDQQDGKPYIAIASLKEIITNDIEAPIANFALSTLMEMTETQTALKNIAVFLQNQNQHTATSLTVLGAIRMELGDQKAAEESFRKAIELQPNSQDPYISLARLLLAKQQKQEALDILKTAQMTVPSEIKALMMKADILINAKKFSEAIAVYETVLNLNNGVDDAANNMAHIIADYKYQDTAALEKARLIAERFINSDNPYYLDTLGWVYARQGLLTQAQAILSRAVNLLEQPNPQIEYHYGYVLHKLGLNEQAKTHLTRAVSGEPYTGYENAKTLLSTLN